MLPLASSAGMGIQTASLACSSPYQAFVAEQWMPFLAVLQYVYHALTNWCRQAQSELCCCVQSDTDSAVHSQQLPEDQDCAGRGATEGRAVLVRGPGLDLAKSLHSCHRCSQCRLLCKAPPLLLSMAQRCCHLVPGLMVWKALAESLLHSPLFRAANAHAHLCHCSGYSEPQRHP